MMSPLRAGGLPPIMIGGKKYNDTEYTMDGFREMRVGR